MQIAQTRRLGPLRNTQRHLEKKKADVALDSFCFLLFLSL